MSSAAPCLDISVVTYNSARWLDAFFRSLLAQNLPTNQIALHIRDNGSLDDTLEQLRRFEQQHRSDFKQLRIEAGPNTGFGQGHNSNLKHCTSEFMLVTNVDLEFEAQTLVILLDKARSDAAEVVSWECRQKPYEHPKDYHPATGDTLWSSSACVLLRVSAMRKIGGYEPMLFLYGEDVELSYRLRDHGFRLRYVPQASVWHHTYEEAAQVKPQQFLGSTLANVLLRCRYGTLPEIIQGFFMYAALFAMRPRFEGQRRGLLKNALRLLTLAPRFLLTRHQQYKPYPFRMWDYALTREGAFYEYPTPAQSAIVRAQARAPVVSVLVRTMPGRSGKLREALASVVAQTYQFIELVVVEDGGQSADSLLEALRQTGRFTDLTYIPMAKGGRCTAGNAALAAATGQLLCFLDDDDLFYADHLEVLVNAWLNQPDLGAVYALAYEVRTEVISEEPWVYRDVEHSLIHRQVFNRAVLWHHNYLPIQTVLFQRQLFLDHGGFDPGLDSLEDWNLWVRYSLHHDFLLVPKVTSLYRVPDNNAKAVKRQEVLDGYYAQAQARHALLRREMSPPEVLQMAEEMARQMYVVAVPASSLRKLFFKVPLLKRLYHPLKKGITLLRRMRA